MLVNYLYKEERYSSISIEITKAKLKKKGVGYSKIDL